MSQEQIIGMVVVLLTIVLVTFLTKSKQLVSKHRELKQLKTGSVSQGFSLIQAKGCILFPFSLTGGNDLFVEVNSYYNKRTGLGKVELIDCTKEHKTLVVKHVEVCLGSDSKVSSEHFEMVNLLLHLRSFLLGTSMSYDALLMMVHQLKTLKYASFESIFKTVLFESFTFHSRVNSVMVEPGVIVNRSVYTSFYRDSPEEIVVGKWAVYRMKDPIKNLYDLYLILIGLYSSDLKCDVVLDTSSINKQTNPIDV